MGRTRTVVPASTIAAPIITTKALLEPVPITRTAYSAGWDPMTASTPFRWPGIHRPWSTRSRKPPWVADWRSGHESTRVPRYHASRDDELPRRRQWLLLRVLQILWWLVRDEQTQCGMVVVLHRYRIAISEWAYVYVDRPVRCHQCCSQRICNTRSRIRAGQECFHR